MRFSKRKGGTSDAPPLKADLADIREHMQGQPEGTKMFWWRGRHRPMHADSFDEAKMREIAAELALAKMGWATTTGGCGIRTNAET